LFAAYATDQIIQTLRRKKPRETLAIVSVAAVLFFVFLKPEHLIPVRQVDYSNMGKAYFANPRLFDLRKAENFAIKCWRVENKIDLDHTHGKSLLASIYDLYAGFLFKKNNIAEAENMLQQSIEVFPFHAYPFKLRSVIYQTRGQMDRAVRFLLIGTLLEPANKSLYEMLLNYYHKEEKNYFKEIPVLRRLLELEERAPMQAALRDELRAHRKKLSEATQTAGLARNRAKTFFLNGQWDSAVPEYERLNAFNVDDDRLFLEQGAVYGNLARYEEALNALYSGLLINPENKEIHKILTDYYFHIAGKPFLAFIHLNQYLHNTPRNGGDEKRRELFERLRYRYGTQERSALIGQLSDEDNRTIFDLYDAR
ncbi:MAG: tetratricopeptide repeat protein, partial [Nitrospinales bacterium]